MEKTIIITGASSGIGEALAYHAAGLGYNVCLAARNSEKLELVKQNCERIGAKCLVLATDVSIETDCKRLVEKTIEEFGNVSVLVNNAGLSMRALFKDVDIQVLRTLMDVNFWGAVYCTKYALPHLLKEGGSLVGVSSIAGIKGLPGRTGYSASKFALHGFMESLRIENLKTGLHVLLACPGFTATNIRNSALNKEGLSQSESPLDESKLMTANKVAHYIFKAIEGRKNYIFLTLKGKATVFLSKYFSKWLDKMVYRSMAGEKDSPFK